MDLSDNKLSLDILDNMQVMFTLWELASKENGDLDICLLYANSLYLADLELTEESAIGAYFSELNTDYTNLLPILIDIALGKEKSKIHLCTQIYSPKYGQVVMINYDMAQFENSREKPNETEERFSELFQSGSFGFCICDIVYDKNDEPVDILFDILNQEFEKMCGFREGSLQGKRLLVEYPNHDTSIFDILNRVVKDKKKNSFIMQNPNNDTSFEVMCYPQSETRIMCITNDVTERMEVEQKARSLAAIVAIADAGIIIKDKDGVVIEWNIGAKNILGYTAEEIIGKTTHYYAPIESHADIDNTEARLQKGEHIIHVEVVRKDKSGRLIDCSASYTPIFDVDGNFTGSVSIFHDISDKKQMELALRNALLKGEERHNIIMSSIDYASKIQKSLLPKESSFKKAFSDYSIIWSPRDIVGGDIYWIKDFDEGTVLCVCDCTGHGTPGAMLTMLIVSALEDIVNESNYSDTAQILWGLEQRLVSIFSVNLNERKRGDIQDGCDLAIVYIAKDKNVYISSGNIHIFVCNGNKVNKIKGQRIFIGEGRLKTKDDINVVKVPFDPKNKFYVASDGLFDQMGGDIPRPFGYKKFMKVILDNHNETQSLISNKILEAFNNHKNKQVRRDDFELISFKP